MMSVKENTSFKIILGDMDINPAMGNQLKLILPMLLIVVTVFNLFDIYDKILSAIGLPQFQFHEQFNDNIIDEGKKLLYRARVQRERKILNQNNKNDNYRKKKFNK